MLSLTVESCCLLLLRTAGSGLVFGDSEESGAASELVHCPSSIDEGVALASRDGVDGTS